MATTSSSDIGVGLMHELAITASKVGWESSDFGKLAQDKKMLERFLKIVRGYEKLDDQKHVIDLSEEPFAPRQFSLVGHTVWGRFEWDPEKIKLAQPTSTDFVKGERCLRLSQVIKEFHRSKLPCGATLLDYLLKHPYLIPEEWKGKRVFFLDSTFKFENTDRIDVRYLRWHGVSWEWDSLEDICRWYPDEDYVAVFNQAP